MEYDAPMYNNSTTSRSINTHTCKIHESALCKYIAMLSAAILHYALINVCTHITDIINVISFKIRIAM